MEDLKKFAAGASAVFNRAVQFTGEKLGTAEHTDLDAHFENLLVRADVTKTQTERLLKLTECLLLPDPTQRAENYVYDQLEKTGLEKRKRERLPNASQLGCAMLEASAAIGPGSAYGTALMNVGQTQQKLGQCERDFVHSTARDYLTPLKAFLEGDMKTITRERRTLELKRLDLDAAKNKIKRAKSEKGRMDAETELRAAQSEFDRQAEVTKLLLEGVSSAHSHHTRCLSDFVDAQASYYLRCHQNMQELQRQLGSNVTSSVGVASTVDNYPAPRSLPPASSSTKNGGGFASLCVEQITQNARVLYDYQASNAAELDLQADQVIEVWPVENESDWMMAQYEGHQGRVPITYIEILRQ